MALAGVVVTVADLHPIAVHARELEHRGKKARAEGATWTSGRSRDQFHLRSTWRLIAAKYIPTLCADSSASPPHGDDKDDDEEATPEEETMPEA